MRFRGTNKAQNWYCPHCKRTTVHRIPDPDSFWQTVDGIRTYHRWHQCSECHNNLKTCELSSPKFDQMLAELDQLRTTKREHERLVEAVRKKQEAEAELAGLFPIAKANEAVSTVA